MATGCSAVALIHVIVIGFAFKIQNRCQVGEWALGLCCCDVWSMNHNGK